MHALAGESSRMAQHLGVRKGEIACQGQLQPELPAQACMLGQSTPKRMAQPQPQQRCLGLRLHSTASWVSLVVVFPLCGWLPPQNTLQTLLLLVFWMPLCTSPIFPHRFSLCLRSCTVSPTGKAPPRIELDRLFSCTLKCKRRIRDGRSKQRHESQSDPSFGKP